MMAAFPIALSVLSSVPFVPNSKVPASKVLELRGGGVTTDQLTNAMATISVGIGLAGWIAPKTLLEAHGSKDIAADDTAFLRVLSSMNFVQGATMFAAVESDISKAASVAMIGWALASCANVPFLESMLGEKKKETVGAIIIFGILGELTRRGVIDTDLAVNISGFLLLTGLLEVFMPKTVLDAFTAIKEPSILSKSLFENFSFAKVTTGAFLLVSQLTGKRGLGFAAAMLSSFMNCLKTYTRADKVGLDRAGLLVWSVLMAAFGLLACKNEMM